MLTPVAPEGAYSLQWENVPLPRERADPPPMEGVTVTVTRNRTTHARVCNIPGKMPTMHLLSQESQPQGCLQRNRLLLPASQGQGEGDRKPQVVQPRADRERLTARSRRWPRAVPGWQGCYGHSWKASSRVCSSGLRGLFYFHRSAGVRETHPEVFQSTEASATGFRKITKNKYTEKLYRVRLCDVSEKGRAIKPNQGAGVNIRGM